MRDGQTNEQLKIELLSQWKLEAEFRNLNKSCNGTKDRDGATVPDHKFEAPKWWTLIEV